MASALLLGVLALLVTGDVLARNLGLGTLPWILEVSEYGLPLATFLVAPWLLHRNEHVRLDVLLTALPRPAARLLDRLSDMAVGLAVSVVFVVYGARAVSSSAQQGSLIIKSVVCSRSGGSTRRCRFVSPSSPSSSSGGSSAPPRWRAAGRTPEPRHPTLVWWLASIVLFGILSALLAVGLPAAFAFLGINVVGAWVWLGRDAGLVQMIRNGVASIASFSLTPIPFFVLMGEVLFHTGVAMKAIDAIDRLIAQVPGRLSVVAVVAGTVFSAISGSTIATTALLGSLMLRRCSAAGISPGWRWGPSWPSAAWTC